MINDFMKPSVVVPPPFAMDQLQRDLPTFHRPVQRTPSPGWAAEYDHGEQSRMEAAFHAQKPSGSKTNGFNPSEFLRFQQQQARASSPVVNAPPLMNGYQQPMGMSYTGPMGMQMS